MANYLKEAFQSLDLIEDKYLKEETFQLGKEKDIEELEDMIDYNENGPDIEEVVDLDADSIEEVKDSYVGDIVIQCPNCTHMYYKTEDEIKLEPKSEESDTLICNVGEECYYCGSESGYDVIGRVAPYEEKVEVKEKEVEKVEDEVVEDYKKSKYSLSEIEDAVSTSFGFNKKETKDYIKKSSPEVLDALVAGFKAEASKSFLTDDLKKKEPEIKLEGEDDGEDEEFDEVSFDEHFNTYLSENYKNRVMYHTDKVFKNKKNLMVEGILEFGPKKRSKIKLDLYKIGNVYRIKNESLKHTLFAKIPNKNNKLITEGLKVKKISNKK